jgi:hypothetical protein
MKLFIFENQKLTVNKEEVLLVKEFNELWDTNRNKIDGDNRGYEKKRAHREFAFIYLMYDWESPYKNFSERERRITAIEDSMLTDKQLQDEKFLAACKKYQEMQDTHMVKLLKSAYRAIDEIRLFYETIDLQERDGDGKPIFNAKQLLDSLSGLGKTIQSVEILEEVVRKQKESTVGKLRGDVEPGIFD